MTPEMPPTYMTPGRPRFRVAGLLGEGLAGAAEEQGYALHDGSGDKGDEIEQA